MRTSETIAIRHRKVPDISVDIDNVNIKIRQGVSAKFARPESRITEESAFWIKLPHQTNVEAIISDYALPLQYLVSLGTGEPNFFESVWLVKSSAPYDPVKLWYSQASFTERKPERLSSDQMVFDCSMIKDNVDEKLRLWMKAFRALEDVMRLFAREHSAPDLFLELRLTTIAQALESYHRIRVRPEETFKTRLTDLFSVRESLIKPVVGDLNKFAEVVRDCRNYFTHYGHTPKVKALDGTSLLLITKCIAIILQSCLLSELEIPIDNQVTFFGTSNVYYILKEHSSALSKTINQY
jgi:hypothetical protein